MAEKSAKSARPRKTASRAAKAPVLTLSSLAPAPGSTRARKRVGRGPGSGLGKTAVSGSLRGALGGTGRDGAEIGGKGGVAKVSAAGRGVDHRRRVQRLRRGPRGALRRNRARVGAPLGRFARLAGPDALGKEGLAISGASNTTESCGVVGRGHRLDSFGNSGASGIEASDLRRRAERPREPGGGDPGRRALPEPAAGVAALGCLLRGLRCPCPVRRWARWPRRLASPFRARAAFR